MPRRTAAQKKAMNARDHVVDHPNGGPKGKIFFTFHWFWYQGPFKHSSVWNDIEEEAVKSVSRKLLIKLSSPTIEGNCQLFLNDIEAENVGENCEIISFQTSMPFQSSRPSFNNLINFLWVSYLFNFFVDQSVIEKFEIKVNGSNYFTVCFEPALLNPQNVWIFLSDIIETISLKN